MSKLGGSGIPLFKLKVEEKGKIRDVKEIIARIQGLPTCLNGQIVNMGEGVKGIVMGFDEQDVLALVLGDESKLRMGKEVSGVSEPFRIPVGDHFVGRMVTVMGEPVDRKGPVEPSEFLPVFRDSPPIVHRAPVTEFLATGTKVVDVLVPIAKGQRQLVMGDRMTGKTVICVDAIVNQKGRNVVCIYCAIGKSLSAIEKVVNVLRDTGALAHTVMMVASDASPVGEQYIAPYAAASMGDYFTSRGRDVLVVLDDLTKHAWAYRQLSLLLERPPGREAYPGDIFYVQVQLMERAGKFNEKHGGGSMTFLGVAETLQGDLTGYIPSNLASMCDGQIYMSSSVFAEGFRPAVDFTLSLSIIGGKAQPPILKDLSRNLRSAYAQYTEVVRLSKLQSGLSGEAEKVVNQGRAILSVLQQGQYNPVTLAEEVLLLYGLQRGHVAPLPDEQKARFRAEICSFARARNPSLLEAIEEKRELTPEIEKGLAEVMRAYFGESGAAAGSAR